MGLFSTKKSANSNINNSVNTSNSMGVSGANNGMMFSGIDGSVTMTDHGAMEAAGEMASDAMTLGSNALASNNSALNDAFSFGLETFNGALSSLGGMASNQSNLASQSMQLANSINASANTGGASDIGRQNTQVMMAFAAVIGLVLLVVVLKR
ncbi:hypothetical protein P0Y67_22595 [Photobacterium sp. SP02]|uniref:Chemotaxis protein n=1 Tax=Photobacterium arenosum TaxID=2774143 RepID=A0ABR9BTR2_9GAMM|nr:hypothetical protein [Photobacterium arenosum]MBD8515285.1 hypothetical protein [Photobacterium arenosum]